MNEKITTNTVKKDRELFMINAIIVISNSIDSDDLGIRLSENLSKICHKNRLPSGRCLNPIYNISNKIDNMVLDMKFMPFEYRMNPDGFDELENTVKSILISLCQILNTNHVMMYKIAIPETTSLHVYFDEDEGAGVNNTIEKTLIESKDSEKNTIDTAIDENHLDIDLK